MARETQSNIKAAEIASPASLKEVCAASEAQKAFVRDTRETIKKILCGRDKRLLLIVGPCSIHDVDAGLEYAAKLKKLAEEVSNDFFIVMRTYFEKPRTTVGWKGLLFDPHLDGSNDINAGLHLAREFLTALAEQQIPAATEFLDPISSQYICDLISWGCIGSRTAESQIHRELASAMPMPVGFKNNTDGNAQIAINGILSASEPHTVITINQSGQVCSLRTDGNPDCHVVLRGGDNLTNYDPESIASTQEALKRSGLPDSLIIDCSHGNSMRQHQKQTSVFQSVIHQVIEGNTGIRGAILESNLFEGKQALFEGNCNLKYGVSVTDACMGWDTTEQLIRWGSQKLCQQSYEEQLSTSTHASF